MKTRKCSIDGCERRTSAKGFCQSHYIKAKRLGEIPGPKCKVENCNKGTYGKGFCHNHHELNRRNGSPTYKKDMLIKCSVPECNRLMTGRNRFDFCKFHVHRRYVSIELNRPFGNKSELNPNWKGGIAEYPDHSLMKRIRKEVLKEANNICQFCGGYANEIHHKDQSKDNHSKDNFIACCHKCNSQIRKPYTSKYKRLYGYTAKKLIEMKIFKNYYEIPIY